ncbi:MAG: DNA polymerase I [Rickettsiales bacterium TMED254]|nr:DNA polymerase I [Rickettsiales bacterium]RPF76430.1 MAG: DNA polymerase I [Rickettsiales bacterium TMED254]
MKTSKQLVLIDGSGYIFRAYYALPNMYRTDGTPVNAVFGFCNMLLKLLEDFQKEKGGNVGFAVIFDAARRTFRNDIYENYKANRSDPPDDLIPQFDIIKRIPTVFNLPSIQFPGFEADDLIASYTKKAIENDIKVTIVSSDKDLMQLLKYNVKIFDPMKKKEIGNKEVIEKFGVDAKKVVDVQSLAGDSADNIPGIPGIGVKTAALLINEYGDLNSLLENCFRIKQNKRRESIENNKDLALLSRKLVTLKDDVDLPISIEDLKFKPLKVDTLINFLDEMEFSRIKSLVISKYGNSENLKNNKKVILDIESDKNKNFYLPFRENIDKTKYKLIQDVKSLIEWTEKINNEAAISIDCETSSLNAMEAKIVGFSMSIENSQACYIPLAHKSKNDEKIKQISVKEFLEYVKPILEDDSILKVGQNIKYDLIILRNIGINVRNIDDTMLMSYVLTSGSNRHNLDEISKIYLSHETIPFSQVSLKGKEKLTFDYIALQAAMEYASEDADVTYRVWEILKIKLQTQKLYGFYFYFERPLIEIIMMMEVYGIKLDFKTLKELALKFEKEISRIEESIFKEAKITFNVGSPKQLGEVLFEKMQLPYAKKGKSGNYQTDISVLEKLKQDKFSIAQKVLDWRQYNKLKTTYCEGLISRENKITNRIHTSFGMASTTTGRLSSNDPNLQNIPISSNAGKQIRKVFVAENGFKIVSIDYSQIELRILAHVANIKTLQSGFIKNYDIHTITAMEVFRKTEREVTDELRRKAKTINFGIIYGISPYGLANQLDISNSEAKTYIERYFKQYPGIQNYMYQTISFCKKNGYVVTPFGRRVYIPYINDKAAIRRNYAERSAINAPIQGGAADLIKRSMIKVVDYLNQKRLKTRMLLQVHDELIFEVPLNEINEVPGNLSKIMELAHEPVYKFSVPLKAEVGIGSSWAEAH